MILPRRPICSAFATVGTWAFLWASPAAAQTSCNATNRFVLDWDVQTPRNTPLGTGARSFAVTNGAGATVTVTMTFAADTGKYTTGGGGAAPAISVQNVGGIGAGQNTLYLATDFASYVSDVASNVDVAAVRFSFSVPVRELTFTVLDIDFNASQFRDWVRISGTSAGSTVPRVETPYGRNNVSNPGMTAPGVAFVGPGTVSGATIVSGDILGTGSSGTADQFGNVTATFAQPVTQAEIRYGNGPTATMGGAPGLQSISIHDLVFCPMPAVAIVKTSAPVATAGDTRFAIPTSDIDYTITVTNSGGSSLDASSIILNDLLPTGVSFNNVDLNPGVAGVQPFVLVPNGSGVGLATANVSYTNNSGASYGYTPAAGVDAAVDGVRFSPTGTMAANSSFSIRFRTRVD